MVHLTTALDPASAVPLYEQLYRSLAAEMRAGTLTAGTRMPGKRRLCLLYTSPRPRDCS